MHIPDINHSKPLSTKKHFFNRWSITCISCFLCTRISNLLANKGNTVKLCLSRWIWYCWTDSFKKLAVISTTQSCCENGVCSHLKHESCSLYGNSQVNNIDSFVCPKGLFKVKLVGNKLNVAFKKNMFRSLWRNFLEWINHWLYSWDCLCNGYIELSITLWLVSLLYHFPRQQLYYRLIPNLHQFSLYSILNLINLIDIQTLFSQFKISYWSNSYTKKCVLGKPTKITSLFFMSNFNDSLAMNDPSRDGVLIKILVWRHFKPTPQFMSELSILSR